MKNILVSLVNWNSATRVLNCISSIQRLTVPENITLHIAVVDNASTDNSLDLFRNDPRFTLIESKQNNGFAAGHALALHEARKRQVDAFWVLNPDLEVEKNTLLAFVEAVNNCGDGLYGGIPLHVTQDNEKLIGTMVYGVDKHGKPLLRNYLIPYQSSYEKTFPTTEVIRAANVSGSCFMVTMNIVERYGFMDERFFMYAEDFDYAIRLAKQGVPVYIVPNAVVYHDLSGTYKHYSRLKNMMEYYIVRNRLIRVRRHSGWQEYFRECRKAINRSGFIKFWIKFLFDPSITKKQPQRFYRCLGIIDAVLNRLGKPFDPEDYISVSPIAHE